MQTVHTKQRYSLIDSVRGFAIINMMLFHLYFDVAELFRLGFTINDTVIDVWQLFICTAFMIISGISLNFSHHALRNGIVLNLLGFLITAVTTLAVPSAQIHFGILNFLGCAILIIQPLRVYIDKIPPEIAAAASALLFIILYGVPNGYIGLMQLRIFQLPDFLYQTDFLAYLGFPSKYFFSADYFPIIPFIFVFIFGYCLYHIIENRNFQTYPYLKIPFIDFIGRHSLVIYMAHQPIHLRERFFFLHIYSITKQ